MLGCFGKVRANSFQDMNWWAALTLLSIYTNLTPTTSHRTSTFDVSSEAEPIQSLWLWLPRPRSNIAKRQLSNPEAVIIFEENTNISRLVEFGKCIQGSCLLTDQDSSDCFGKPRHCRRAGNSFKDQTLPHIRRMTLPGSQLRLFQRELCRNRGQIAGASSLWKKGVSVSKMNALTVTLYSGKPFDGNAHAFVVTDEEKLPAIWCFFQAKPLGLKFVK